MLLISVKLCYMYVYISKSGAALRYIKKFKPDIIIICNKSI